jgi:hypothetical protein
MKASPSYIIHEPEERDPIEKPEVLIPLCSRFDV